MATYLHTLAVLVALFSLSCSLTQEEDKLKNHSSKIFQDNKKNKGLVSDLPESLSKDALMNSKLITSKTALFTENEDTIPKQIKSIKSEENKEESSWKLSKVMKKVLNMVKNLNIKNVIGQSNDSETKKKPHLEDLVDVPKEAKGKNKTDISQEKPLTGVLKKSDQKEGNKNKKHSEDTKRKQAAEDLNSPSSGKWSYDEECDLESSSKGENKEDIYEEEESCEESIEIIETTKPALSESLNQNNLKRTILNNGNPQNSSNKTPKVLSTHESNYKRTTLSSNQKIPGQNKDVILIPNVSKVKSVGETTKKDGVSGPHFNSVPITPNLGVTSSDQNKEREIQQNHDRKSSPPENEFKISLINLSSKKDLSSDDRLTSKSNENKPETIQNSKLQEETNQLRILPVSKLQAVTTPYYSEKNINRKTSPATKNTSSKMPDFQIQNFSSQTPSDDQINSIAPSANLIDKSFLQNSVKQQLNEDEDLSEPRENIKYLKEKPTNQVRNPKINNGKNTVNELISSLAPGEISKPQSPIDQLHYDEKNTLFNSRNGALYKKSEIPDLTDDRIYNQNLNQQTIQSLDAVQYIPDKKIKTQKLNENINILQMSKDISLTQTLVSQENFDVELDGQNELLISKPLLEKVQDMPAKKLTEQSFKSSQSNPNDKQHQSNTNPSSSVQIKMDQLNPIKFKKDQLNPTQPVLQQQDQTNPILSDLNQQGQENPTQLNIDQSSPLQLNALQQDHPNFVHLNANDQNQPILIQLNNDQLISVQSNSDQQNIINPHWFNSHRPSFAKLNTDQKAWENAKQLIPIQLNNGQPSTVEKNTDNSIPIQSNWDVQNQPISVQLNADHQDQPNIVQLNNYQPNNDFSTNQQNQPQSIQSIINQPNQLIPFQINNDQSSFTQLKSYQQDLPYPIKSNSDQQHQLNPIQLYNDQPSSVHFDTYQPDQSSPIQLDKVQSRIIQSNSDQSSPVQFNSDQKIQVSPIQFTTNQQDDQLNVPHHSKNDETLSMNPNNILEPTRHKLKEPPLNNNQAILQTTHSLPSVSENTILIRITGEEENKEENIVSNSFPFFKKSQNIQNQKSMEEEGVNLQTPRLPIFLQTNKPTKKEPDTLRDTQETLMNNIDHLQNPNDDIQKLSLDGILSKISTDDLNKFQYSSPSSPIRNSQPEEKLLNVPNDRKKESSKIIKFPRNSLNSPTDISNRIPSDELNKLQYLVPSPNIQKSPLEDALIKIPTEEQDEPLTSKPPPVDTQNSSSDEISNNISNTKLSDIQKSVPFPDIQNLPANNVGNGIPNDEQNKGLNPIQSQSDTQNSPMDDSLHNISDARLNSLQSSVSSPDQIPSNQNKLGKDALIKNSNEEQKNNNSPMIPGMETSPENLHAIKPSEKTNSENDVNMETDSENESNMNTDFEDHSDNETGNFSSEDKVDDSIEGGNDDNISYEDSYLEDDEYDELEEEFIYSSSDKIIGNSEKDVSVNNSVFTFTTPQSDKDNPKKEVTVNSFTFKDSPETNKQENEKEAEKPYGTFLEFLYRHSNSPFIQSLRENSTLS